MCFTQVSLHSFQNFIPCLKDHFLAQLHGLAYNGDEYNFSNEDHDSVIIGKNKLFQHSTLHINYITYNLQREQDIINP
ncbi:hypothetical protein BDR04DRAFT_1008383 [Suillus decipiens]|nr:hypothetical protein BDR04DRAFT_1008383 [Suillus decipiens]